LTAIAEAYLHFKPYDVSASRLEGLGEIATSLAAEAARRTYGFDLTIEIAFERGSLKVRVKILAQIAAAIVGTTWGAIATYPDFRAGLTLLVVSA
jgi:alkylhydroperoxidase/carboxymuconolactone decarboxylase family protein YurZ